MFFLKTLENKKIYYFFCSLSYIKINFFCITLYVNYSLIVQKKVKTLNNE